MIPITSASKLSRTPLILIAGIFALLFTQLFLFHDFIVEDAYITLRVAKNFADHGTPISNLEDAIMVYTSPLHMFVEAGLFKLFGSAKLLNQWLGAALLWVSLLFLSMRVSDRWETRGIFLLATLTSPFANLWAFGGLETPYLGAIVNFLAYLSLGLTKQSSIRIELSIWILLAMAVLTRYDASVFLTPVAVAMLLNIHWKRRLALGALAAVPLAAWFLFTLYYYHDLFPTSFYEKTPSWNSLILQNGLNYWSEFILFSGSATLLFVLFLLYKMTSPSPGSPKIRNRNPFIIAFAIGIVTISIYGLSASTTHMMFAYRLWIPYFPVAALLLCRLLDRIPGVLRSPNIKRSFIDSLLIIYLFFNQCIFSCILFSYSLNPGWTGEYLSDGSDHYTHAFMAVLNESSESMRSHWDERKTQGRQSPTVITMTAGVPSNSLPQSYLIDVLNSYRHHCPIQLTDPIEYFQMADYIHFLEPTLSLWKDYLDEHTDRYEVVYHSSFRWYNREETLWVYYNLNPGPNRLPKYIDSPCDIHGNDP